jgi:hypothetical protein
MVGFNNHMPRNFHCALPDYKNSDITFAVLYGTCGVCACCIGLLVASLNAGGKCCALLFLIALMVGPGVAGLVVTHSAACSDYDGEFLWVVIVVNGSMSVAFAGLVLIAAAAPVCLFIPSGDVKASSATAAAPTSASVVPGMVLPVLLPCSKAIV